MDDSSTPISLGNGSLESACGDSTWHAVGILQTGASLRRQGLPGSRSQPTVGIRERALGECAIAKGPLGSMHLPQLPIHGLLRT